MCSHAIQRGIVQLAIAVLLFSFAGMAQQTLSVSAELDQAYARLHEGRLEEALQVFDHVLERDPANRAARLESGYICARLKRWPEAVAHFDVIARLEPQNLELRMNLAYALRNAGELQRAAREFEGVGSSPGPWQARARAELQELKRQARARRAWYFDVFANPVYLARFSNGIASMQTRLGWRPKADQPLSFYLGTRITRDTRSVGGALPVIFSDDVGLFGAGVLIAPARSHFSFFAEANAAVALVRRPGVADIQSDFRVVGAYFRRWDGRCWGPLGWISGGQLRGERLFSDIDGSVGYYSRYHHNAIGYLQVREGVRLVQPGSTQLFAYVKYSAAKDSRRDFYNNLGEGGAGLEFRPRREANLGFRLEYLRGGYFGEARDPNPYRPNYNDLRFSVVYGRRF